MGLEINCPDRAQAQPDLVIIDLDNTLYAYAPAHEAALAAVSAKAQALFNITDAAFRDLYGQARDEIKTRLGSVAGAHSRLLYFQHLSEHTDMGANPLIALDLEQTYWSAYLSAARLFDGAHDFLEELRLADIACACLTDLTAQIQFRKLFYLRLDHFFQVLVTSEEVGQEKPAREAFDLVVRKSRLKPRTIWMIGDDPEKDIAGARESLGAVTFLRCDKLAGGRGYHGGADIVFDDFHALTRHLRGAVSAPGEPARLSALGN